MWKFICLSAGFFHTLMSFALVRSFERKSEERFLISSEIIDWTE